MIENPFPGPQPYREADHERFFSRDELIRRLSNQVIARKATTVYGPSGAGKSSLMQAGVIPELKESDALRVVRVDSWPANEAPLKWFVAGMFSELDLGELPTDTPARKMLEEALELAERRSDRPILIYLDQIEQIFVAMHDDDAMNELLSGLDWLIRSRQYPDLHLVLSLREDYLGRLRDWMRDHEELSAHGFRVAPLSVKEMAEAMCKTNAASPHSHDWDEQEILRLMMDVRVPGQRATEAAEVQAAFGQIVCRALWERHKPWTSHGSRELDAEAILQQYLDDVVMKLGSEYAQRVNKLLEDYLIDAQGNRTLLTEKQAHEVLPKHGATLVLERLEKTSVLHAEEHQGSRYFELGHDWLAKQVFEKKKARQLKVQWQATREAEAHQASRVDATSSVVWLKVLTVLSLAIAAWMGWLAWSLRP